MTKRCWRWMAAAMVVASIAPTAQAQGASPGMAGETRRDIVLLVDRTDLAHFNRLLEGCEARAATAGLRCRLATASDLIEQADGLANPDRTAGIGIAVPAPIPDPLINVLRSVNTPKIAVDVDVGPLATRAFVGTNNRDIGRALGEAVRRLKPAGATVAVITDHRGQGAAHERWLGVVDRLGPAWPILDNAPYPSGGDPDAAAQQAARVLTPMGDPPAAAATVLISLGPWPMLATDMWSAFVQSIRPALDRREIVILAADASDTQIRQLRESMAHALAAAPAARLGEATAQAFIDLARGKRIPDISYVGVDIVTRDSVTTPAPPR